MTSGGRRVSRCGGGGRVRGSWSTGRPDGSGRRESRGDSQRPWGVQPRANFVPSGERLAAHAPRPLPYELLHARAHRPEERRRGGGAGAGTGRAGKTAGAQVTCARCTGPHYGRAKKPVGPQGGRITVLTVEMPPGVVALISRILRDGSGFAVGGLATGSSRAGRSNSKLTLAGSPAGIFSTVCL